MANGQDSYVALPNGSYVQVPANATPEQLSALRDKLRGQQQPSFYERLTRPIDPGTGTNPVTRALSSAGGALIGAPGALYHAVTDQPTAQETEEFKGHTRIPGELAIERLTSAPIVRAAQDWKKMHPSVRDILSVLPETLGQVVGTVAAGEVGGKALDVAKPAAKAIGRGARTVGKELSGGGPTMDRLLAAKDMNALKVKNEILQPLAKAVHDDAQKTIQSALAQMERNSPGVVNKVELADAIDATFDQYVKTPEKLQPAINKLLAGKDGPKSAARALTQKELNSSLIAGKLFKEGLSKNEVKDILKNQGFAPKQIDAIMSIASPQADTGFWSASELQQIRSDLGGEVFGRGSRSFEGPVRHAGIEAYRHVSNILDQAAERANAQQAWRVGNAKWKTYKETFEGKYEGGSFNDSPIGSALSGQTADEIIGALNAGRLQWTKDLLGRYRQFSGRIPDIVRAIDRHNSLEMWRKFSHPSKWELSATALYPFAPGTFETMAGFRLLTPPLMRWLKTRGINPENVRGFQEVQPGVPPELPK